ncbi:MAG TPA: sigma-70 family RNA polymerase sigma factor [Actinomycetota bacterium]|nr:sigma-70 family RNA polymerase sigma factor [Actinomycetota bacterium]
MDRRRRFEELYEATRRPLLAYALRRVGPDEAKDVVAETFLVAWRRLDDVPDDALPWLYGVARKVAATAGRADSRRSGLVRRMVAEARPERAGDPASALHDREALADAFASLRPRDREVLTLVALDGLDVGRAAVVLGCTPATLSVRLHRARRRLARALEPRAAGRKSLFAPDPRLEESR